MHTIFGSKNYLKAYSDYLNTIFGNEHYLSV